MTVVRYPSLAEPPTEAELAARRERWERLDAMPANQARLAAAHAKRDLDADELLAAAGVPSRALAAALEPQSTPAIEAVQAQHVDLLVLSSVPGTGKSVAAARWLLDFAREPKNWRYRASIDQGYRAAPDTADTAEYSYIWLGATVVWTTAADLQRLDHFSRDAFDRVAKASRLVIDDLGAEFSDAKGFFASLLDELIDARYAHCRPTIITTNLDAEAFRARYGARIVDRIREAGRFVGCGSESLRRRPTP